MARITSVRGRHLALVAIALAASTRLLAAERHNIVLFIPELLSAASAEDRDPPTLTRLRDEGVNFLESHSRFPPLAAQSSQIDPDFMSDVLIQRATAAQYSAVLLENVDVDREVAATLRSFKDATRPFVLIYRITGNSARSCRRASASAGSRLPSIVKGRALWRSRQNKWRHRCKSTDASRGSSRGSPGRHPHPQQQGQPCAARHPAIRPA